MTAENYSGPTVGSPVLTADSDQLGTAKTVGDRSFDVNAPMKPDYWLPVSAIASIGADGGRLSFNKPQLDRFRQEHLRVD